MMWFKWLILAYAALSISVGLGDVLSRYPLLPDPVFLLGLYAIIAIDHPLGFAVAGLIGLADDLVWSERIGPTMLALQATGFALGGSRRWFGNGSIARLIGIGTLLAASALAARSGVLVALDRSSVDWEAFVLRAIAEGSFYAAGLVALDRLVGYAGDHANRLLHPAAPRE